MSKYILAGLIAASASVSLTASSNAQISQFPFTLDGKFSGGGEWSDVTPFTFLSVPGQTATPVPLGSGNTELWAAISHNVASASGDLQLHLLYDFLPRTSPPSSGETFASVSFPVTLPNRPTGDRTNISVLFIGNGGPSFFDVFVDLNLDGTPDFPAAALGILGSASASPSSLGATPHLIAELEVPLRIPAGFATPPPGGGQGLPGGGINPATGLYDPDPVFWGAAGSGDGTAVSPGGGSGGPLQSASAATIGINPNGSLTITPGAVPEPTSAALLLAGLGVFAARRRRQTAI